MYKIMLQFYNCEFHRYRPPEPLPGNHYRKDQRISRYILLKLLINSMLLRYLQCREVCWLASKIPNAGFNKSRPALRWQFQSRLGSYEPNQDVAIELLQVRGDQNFSMQDLLLRVLPAWGTKYLFSGLTIKKKSN